MKTMYISKNEKVLGGEPVITGTRIPVDRLRWLVKQGYNEKNIKKEFPQLSIKKIREVLFELTSLGIHNL